MTNRLLNLVLSAYLIGAQAGALAAEDLPTQDTARVEVKGQYDARREDTASKTVINSAEITRYGDTSLLDVLRRLPAITVSGATIRMRGLGSGYTQVLLNGEKAPAGFAIESLPPGAIEKIEILRSATAATGAQAIAGTINIVTRKVVRAPRRDLTFSLGDEGGRLTPYFTAQSASREGNLSRTLMLAASQSRFDTPSTGTQRYANAAGTPTAAIDSSQRGSGSMDSIFFTPRFNWKGDAGTALASQSLLRVMRNTSATDENSVNLFGAELGFSQGRSTARSTSKVANTNLNVIHRFNAQHSLDAKVGVSWSARDGEQHFDGVGRAGQPSLARQTDSISVDREFTSSGKDAISLVPGHTLLAGWDAGQSQRRESRRESELLDEDFSVRVRRMAVLVQDEWNVSPRASVYLGARYDYIGTRSAGSGRDTSTHSSAVFSPSAQALYKLAGLEGAQVRLALARTYKPPAVGSLNAREVRATVNTPATPDYRGNPALRPELSWGLDCSYEYYREDGAMFSAGGYVRRIADITGHALRRVDGRWVSMPANVDDARSYGIELETRFTAASLAWRANLNRNWSQVDSIPGPDNRLDGQTPLTLNVGVDYAVPARRLSWGANFGLQTGGTVRSSLTETVSGSVVRSVDTYAVYRVDRHLQWRLALSNLLHQDTWSESRVQDMNASVTRSQRERHAPTVRLTLEYVF